ncbi:MAG TPA: alanine racemase [Tepidisphaeraceae bacterium]|jgi:alanine racemase|nr:alanine racemase [Tepidisphaeraceae bacterium]
MDAKHSLGEPRVLISRQALLHNASVIRRSLDPSTRICAILKADAYGHGAEIVADTLCNFTANGSLRPAVDMVAVASLDEAAALPDVALPVIIFRPLENIFIGRQRQKIEEAIRCGWTMTVCSASAADDLSRIAMTAASRASVQVMVDTGMTRSGVCVERLDEVLQKISSRPSLRLAGICTHFANAEDCQDPFTRDQLLAFRAATDEISESSRGRIARHAANSAGVFFHPDSHFDMVRPGLALYGIDPTGKPSFDRPLKPALKWTAPLISAKTVRKGTGVGYGQTWQAPRDTLLGLVPIGYADGYPRSLSNKAVVVIHGKKAPVVGRVSMDMLTVDLGEIPGVRIGDEVTLLEDDPLSPVSVYKLAEWQETIPYEVFCRIGPRVQRVVVEVEQAELPHMRSSNPDM